MTENTQLNLGDVFNMTVFIKNPGLSGPSNVLRVDWSISVITEECMQNPCLNGGSCQDGNPTFTCVCLPGKPKISSRYDAFNRSVSG